MENVVAARSLDNSLDLRVAEKGVLAYGARDVYVIIPQPVMDRLDNREGDVSRMYGDVVAGIFGHN